MRVKLHCCLGIISTNIVSFQPMNEAHFHYSNNFQSSDAGYVAIMLEQQSRTEGMQLSLCLSLDGCV